MPLPDPDDVLVWVTCALPTLRSQDPHPTAAISLPGKTKDDPAMKTTQPADVKLPFVKETVKTLGTVRSGIKAGSQSLQPHSSIRCAQITQ